MEMSATALPGENTVQSFARDAVEGVLFPALSGLKISSEK